MQSDLNDLHRKNLESLESSLRAAREAREIGETTNVTLAEQEQQLHRIHEKTLEVDHNVKKSKRLVKGMSSFFGRVKGWFKKEPKRKQTELPKPAEKTPAPAATIPTKPIVKPTISRAATEHQQKEQNLRRLVAEEDKVLDEVNYEILRLQQIARDMGENLEMQNQYLDTITAQVETNERNISKVTADSKKLLR